MDSVLIGGLMDPVTGLLGEFIEEWNLDRSCVAASFVAALENV